MRSARTYQVRLVIVCRLQENLLPGACAMSRCNTSSGQQENNNERSNFSWTGAEGQDHPPAATARAVRGPLHFSTQGHLAVRPSWHRKDHAGQGVVAIQLPAAYSFLAHYEIRKQHQSTGKAHASNFKCSAPSLELPGDHLDTFLPELYAGLGEKHMGSQKEHAVQARLQAVSRASAQQAHAFL